MGIYKFDIDSTFDINKTLECGQCFHYLVNNDEYLVYGYNDVCRVWQESDVLFIQTERDINYWVNYFSLDMKYIEILRYLESFAVKENDDFAIKAIQEGKGIRILRQPFFETCCSYILSQQNNIPRIKKMIFSLSDCFSSINVSLNGRFYNCFPKYADLLNVSEDRFKELGMGYRSEYLEKFIHNWENTFDKIKFKYEDDFKLLKSNKGIGDKVANCICLYGFEEYDAFPIDVWMKRIIQEEYQNKGKELKIPDKYAGILQQFMFYTKRNEKKMK